MTAFTAPTWGQEGSTATGLSRAFLLPCNVIVYATDAGKSTVAAMGMVQNEEMNKIAQEVQERLMRVLENL